MATATVPIVYPDIFSRPEHVTEWFAKLLKESPLPLRYVAKYEESLFPEYPAVLVQPGSNTKTLHGTHTFLVTMRVNLYVMHADLTKDTRTRSLEDCLLATSIIELLEKDMTLGGHIIAGHVESDTFAPLPPRSQQSPAVISTRLQWQGLSETRFK